MGFSSLKNEELQNLYDFVQLYSKSSASQQEELIKDLAELVKKENAEKIVKKYDGTRMQLGISFLSKLNFHMNQCHAAEMYMKDKLNETDFSWLPALSSQAEELWKQFQEEFEVHKKYED